MSKFNAGDLVYQPNVTASVVRVVCNVGSEYPISVGRNSYTNDGRYVIGAHSPSLFHATKENYELLSKLYPEVEFEAPPKSEQEKLHEALAAGKPVLCWVDDSDAGLREIPRVIKRFCVDEAYPYAATNGTWWKYAIPVKKSEITFLEDL